MNENNQNPIRLKRHLFTILSAWVIISMACALPGLTGAPTATPAVQLAASQPAASPTPNTPLPPVLVETEPQPGSTVSLQEGLTFYFNQPMDHSSVEAALQVQPSLGGSFKWQDNLTVKYTPDQPFPPAADINVKLTTAAHATGGLALSAPVELAYHTAGALRVAQRLPDPNSKDIDPSSAVVVTFTMPVVPLSAEANQGKPAFTLDPSAKGRGEWLNTSSYIFYPDPPLLGGASYTVQLDPGLLSTLGTALANDPDQPKSWTFNTALPKLTDSAPSSQSPILLDAGFVLTFNQPMDSGSLQQNFILQDSSGSPVSGKFSWDNNSTVVTFKPDQQLNRDTGYTLKLPGKVQARGGTTLGTDTSLDYHTVSALSIASSTPASGSALDLYNGYGNLEIDFNAPLLPKQDLIKLITLEPAITSSNIYTSPDISSVYLSGFFTAGTSYTLHVSPALMDRFNGAYSGTTQLTFRAGSVKPSLSIPILLSGSSTLFLTPKDTQLTGQVTNVNNVTVSSGPISINDFIQFNESVTSGPTKPANVHLTTWRQATKVPANLNQPVGLSLAADGSSLAPGLYYYTLDAPELHTKNSQAVNPFTVVISKIHLLVKRSDNQMLVWAVDLDSNAPLTGAKVTLATKDNPALATAVTDNQGLSTFNLPLQKVLNTTYYITVGQPGDTDFSLATDGWSNGVAGWDFGLPVDTNHDQPMAYLYSDRPIYKPGDTVNFRAVLRQINNGRYDPLGLKQITAKVLGNYSVQLDTNPVLATLTLPVDAYGASAGSYSLPKDAQPGYYSIQIGEIESASLGFQVAAYVKPEVDLQVKFANPEYISGQDIQAAINTKYFFGAPASNLPVHWALYASPQYFDIPGGYQTGKITPFGSGNELFSPLGKLVVQQDDKTSPAGLLNLTFKSADLKDLMDSQTYQKLTLEVTTQDPNTPPVSSRVSALFHPADFYAGVRPEAWTVQAGSALNFSVLTVNHQQGHSGNHHLSANFQKVEWVGQGTFDLGTGGPALTPKYTPIGSTDFQTDASGQARLTFTPPDPGTYQLDVSGEGALTQINVWVGGKGSASWPMLPDQHIQLTADAASYKAGDSAHVFIPNPFGQNTLALITVERSKVMRSQVLTFSDASYEYTLPLSDEDAPNIYLSVTLLGRQPDGTLDFRQGYLQFQVQPAAETLKVDLNAQSSAQPGQQVNFNLQVKDANGKPVQGEFSLAVVDKATLALTDPNSSGIVDAFYAAQPLGVVNSLDLAIYGRRIALTPGGKGGGGGPASQTPSVRENLPDTAYWNAVITTDASGQARVAVNLPDNVTTWVSNVRGLTSDTRVGEATTEIVVSKDLLIRPVTPTFLVAGDHLELAALVNNNTAQKMAVQVSLQSTGITLDDPNKSVQNINVEANSQVKASWWGTIQDIDQVDLAFNAQSGNLQDASKPAQGSLPVLQYSSSQTFATTGVLTKGGDQLEIIGLPRSFKATGGSLDLELSPSLAAEIISGLKSLDSSPSDFTESILSRLLPNLETYRTLKDLGLDVPTLKDQLDATIQSSIGSLSRTQNKDGGWGWSNGQNSDSYISAYVLFGLGQAVQEGVLVDQGVIQKAQQYTLANAISPDTTSATWQLDRLVFQNYALLESGYKDLDPGVTYGFRDKLNPWAQAMLVLSIQAVNPKDTRINDLMENIKGKARQTATGAHWQDEFPGSFNLSGPDFETALVILALAKTDPASPLLTNALRYLIANRQVNGGWSSSYQTAWVLMAMSAALKGTGDLQASFVFSASLNGAPLANGKAGGPDTLTPISAQVPLSQLNATGSNSLRITRASGAGSLYYQAFLQVKRPADTAQPVNNGLTISRSYYGTDQPCQGNDCKPIDSIQLGNNHPPVMVKLSITVPEDMPYVVVEDTIPAGAQILNQNLKTSQQGQPPAPLYNQQDPFSQGWGWWNFSEPRIYSDHIQWIAQSLPAGSYELTYQLVPQTAGEFRLIPAHVYQNYSPEVEGNSAGGIFKILP
jgi:alpha-2-macroglobulin